MEELGLSVRARNALRSVGCNTIGDVLRLDFSIAVRGLGHKTREEVASKLADAGFQQPPAPDESPSEVRAFERSLDRIEERIGAALSAMAREIRLIRQRLRKKAPGKHRDGRTPRPGGRLGQSTYSG